MNKFYISNFSGRTGIDKYSVDFYHFILKKYGYEHLDVNLGIEKILSMISRQDEIYIEIGLRQFVEVEVLFRLLEIRYENVSITLHDPPYLRYPFFCFKNRMLNNVSKIIHIYAGYFGAEGRYFNQIKRIFVLTKKAARMLKTIYPLANIQYMPLLIRPDVTVKNMYNKNLLFYGHITEKKGINYACVLHNEILKRHPLSKMYIAGEPGNDKEKRRFEKLIDKFNVNVCYLGYLSDQELERMFDRISFVLLPFKEYGRLIPASSSILNALGRGKVVATTVANAADEYIVHKENGLFLSGDVKNDSRMLCEYIEDHVLYNLISRRAVDRIRNNNSPDAVNCYFNYAQ